VTRRFWICERPYPDADEGSATPIWVAAQHGHAEVVRFLADKGGDVSDCFNIDCCVEFCFDVAVRFGHVECVRVLHEKGARIGCDLNLGNMANVAAANNHPHVLNYLTSIGKGPVEDDTLSFNRPWRKYDETTESWIVRTGSLESWLADKPDLRVAIQHSKDTVKQDN